MQKSGQMVLKGVNWVNWVHNVGQMVLKGSGHMVLKGVN